MESTIVLTTSKADLQRSVDEAVNRALRKFTDSLDTDNPKAWLTNREAMQYLGLSKPTLQRLRSTGQLPFSKLNGSVYYKLADVEALLEASEVSR